MLAITLSLSETMNAFMARFSVLVSSAAVLALLSGCSTVKTGHSSVSHLPNNTLVIRNRTACTLTVLRNGVVLKHPETQDGRAYQWPVEVPPHQELVLYNVTSQPSERIKLGLWATKTSIDGSEPRRITAGEHSFGIRLSTNSPPVVVTIRSTGF